MRASTALLAPSRYREQVTTQVVSGRVYAIYVVLTLATTLFGLLVSRSGWGLVLGGGLVAAIAPYAIILARGDWANPLVIYSPFLMLRGWGVMLSGMGLVPIQISFFGWMGTETVRDLMEKAIAVEVIGVVALYAGYQMMRLVQGEGRSGFYLPLVRNVGLAAGIILAIAWYANSVIIDSAGSVAAMIEGMAGRRQLYAGVGYYAKLSRWGIFAALLFLYKRKLRLALVVLVGQILVAVAMGDRGNVIFYSLLPFTVFWHYTRSPVSIKSLVLPVAAVLMFFQLFGEYRQSREIQSSSRSDIVWNSLGYAAANVRNTAAAIYVIDSGRSEFFMGETLLRVAYAPVPRSIWPEKPIIAESGVVGRLILNKEDGYGMPPGTPGYGYLNFGWIGVLLFPFVSGMIVYWFYRRMIGVYRWKGARVPEGNALFYALLCLVINVPLSTEVQVSILMNLPVLGIVWALCGSRRSGRFAR